MGDTRIGMCGTIWGWEGQSNWLPCPKSDQGKFPSSGILYLNSPRLCTKVERLSKNSLGQSLKNKTKIPLVLR